MHSSECLFTDSYLLRRFQGHTTKNISLQMFPREGKQDVNVSNVHGHLLGHPPIFTCFFYIPTCCPGSICSAASHLMSEGCWEEHRRPFRKCCAFSPELVDSVAVLKMCTGRFQFRFSSGGRVQSRRGPQSNVLLGRPHWIFRPSQNWFGSGNVHVRG